MTHSYTYVYTPPPPEMFASARHDEFQSELITYIALLFGIEEKMLFADSRTEKIKYARWMIWEIIYATSGRTLKDVAKIFGHDHTTIMNALNKLASDIEHKPYLKHIWSAIILRMKIDEAAIKQMRKERVDNQKKRKILKQAHGVH